MYQYQSESMSTSNKASIDPNAHAIHHRTTLHAIHQNIIEMIKLSRENRIFDCSCWCNNAVSRGIDRAARTKTQK